MLHVILKAKKLCAAHYLTCGNPGPGKYLFYEWLQPSDRPMVAVHGKWHCRNTIVEVDRHYGFSEQEYRAQLAIICNSQPPPAETHAVQDLHGGLRERDVHYPHLTLLNSRTNLPVHLAFSASIRFLVGRCRAMAFSMHQLRSESSLAPLPRKSNSWLSHAGSRLINARSALSLI
jgi:hypothetical protein